MPVTVTDPETNEDEDMIAVGGATYPLKEMLKERGFKFTNEINGEGAS